MFNGEKLIDSLEDLKLVTEKMDCVNLNNASLESRLDFLYKAGIFEKEHNNFIESIKNLTESIKRIMVEDAIKKSNK